MNKNAKYHVFIGHDDRENDAYEVCRYSILTQTDADINVIPLKHHELRQLKMFWREWKILDDGTYVDKTDGRPFSTQFSHSRFLVPALAKYYGLKGQAMFIDCDFLFLGDIEDVFKQAKKQNKIVSVVKHDYVPDVKIKMDNREQFKYNKKLWSALMIFDLECDALYDKLTKEYVNEATGKDLHAFKWLQSNDELIDMEIGSLDEAWQFIPDHSEPRVKDIKAIHYTLGGPWFPHMTRCSYNEMWWRMYLDFVGKALYPTLEDMVRGT